MSGGSQSSGATPPSSGGGNAAPADQIVRAKGSGRTGLYVVVAVIVVIVLVLAGAYATGYLKLGSKSSTVSCSSTSSAVTPAVSASSVPAVPTPRAAPAAGQTLTGAGSTLVFPLMYQWETSYTNNTVDYSGVGSTAGINDITGKTVDYGATDAPMNPTQQAAVTPKGGIDTIPESAGAAVPIYNLPTVSSTLKFTGSILAGIYLGLITNWNNSALQLVNPGVVLPNACIIVVHRSDGSGTSFVWTSYLSRENSTWNRTVGFSTSPSWPVGVGSKGNGGVTTTVKSTVDAIGYVDINYALTNGVAFGAVQNPAGNFVQANLTNIASAINDSHVTFPAANASWYNVTVLNAPGSHDYPLATFTYVLVYANESAAGYLSTTVANALIDFLKWMVTVGQTYAAELYYVPLPHTVVTEDLATINAIVP